MKKFTLLLALMVGFALTGIQAQSHSDKEAKACAKSCSKTAKTASKDAKSAAKLASLDDSIEQQVAEGSGEISYVRTDVSADGGAQLVPVTYSASTKEFVAISDSKSAKACCSSGGAKTASAKSEAGCCSKKGAKAATTGSSAPAKTKDTKKSDS